MAKKTDQGVTSMKLSPVLIQTLRPLLLKELDPHAIDMTNDDSPWYINVFMAACGWLAALFMLAFLILADIVKLDTTISLLFLGSLFVGSAFFMLKKSPSEFVIHLALAGSVTGQVLIVIGLFNVGSSADAFNFAAIATMQCLLAFVMPSYIHRVMSGYFATLALGLFLSEIQLASIYSGILLFFVALMWLNEFTFSPHIKQLQAAAYGATVGVIQFKTSLLFAGSGTWQQEQFSALSPWIDELLNIFVLYYIVLQLVKHRHLPFVKKIDSQLRLSNKTVGIALLALITFATFYAQGIALGLTILLLGYSAKNTALFVLGVIAMIVNLSSYYYLLDITLLNKSLILSAIGIASLLLSVVYKKVNIQQVAADE
jgi:uncharacterized membrane protein